MERLKGGGFPLTTFLGAFLLYLSYNSDKTCGGVSEANAKKSRGDLLSLHEVLFHESAIQPNALGVDGFAGNEVLNFGGIVQDGGIRQQR